MNVIDEYIAQYPENLQKKLHEIRRIIRANAPEATEIISWRMPTFYQHGNLVHFAMHKTHVGLYPGADGVAFFEERLGEYKHSKGAIQFPLDQPLPEKLIADIVAFRVKQNNKK